MGISRWAAGEDCRHLRPHDGGLRASLRRTSAAGTGSSGDDDTGTGQLPPRPASRALTMAWARSVTWSLVKMLDTWLRTVFRLIIRWCAMAALPWPAATIS